MKIYISRRKVSILVCLGLFLCSDNTVRAQTITIKGSTTVLPIAQKCAEEFMNNNPNVDITVQGGGSGNGIASLIDGTTDIADASRSMKDKEIKKAIQNGIDPVAHVVAMDGIAVVVNPSNPISAITKNQIKEIYVNGASNWSQFGGSGGIIVPVSRDTSSGTYEAFRKLALDKRRVRPDALLQASNQSVKNTVAKTPGAIGYIGIAYLDKSIKTIPVNGVMPSAETVLSGEYKLSRPLFMYTNGKPTGFIKRFLDFVTGSKGQKLVSEVGYIPLK